jgi:hypothetical protein
LFYIHRQFVNISYVVFKRKRGGNISSHFPEAATLQAATWFIPLCNDINEAVFYPERRTNRNLNFN